MTYQLMVTDANSGCISAAPSSVLLTVNPAPTVIDAATSTNQMYW